MANLSGVFPLPLSDGLRDPYDLFLATVGYEYRANYVSKKLKPKAKRKVACVFPDRHVGAFPRNRDWFVAANFDILSVKDIDIEKSSESFINDLGDNASQRICVDISSISRLRLAALIAALLRVSRKNQLVVDFIYAVAQWSAPARIPDTMASAGAVLPIFAGWSNRPDLPTVAVIGLGYEPDRAVGAYEYLEATQVWTFCPNSADVRYDRDVGRANKTLLERVPEQHRVQYRVDGPYACFALLEAVVYGLLPGSRPVLLPFGPKIFSLCALLVACVHRQVPVWRLSSGQLGKATSQKPSGQLVGLRAVFG